MAIEVEVKTQAEFDVCVKAGNIPVCRQGYFKASGSATVTASDSATVTAYDSATVRASGSATVAAYGSATVTAYGSATVTASGSATVTAYDSATVTAYGSATVTASDSATVTASGSATVTASGHTILRVSNAVKVIATATVIVAISGSSCSVKGGIKVNREKPNDAKSWCLHYGIKPNRGIVVLFKAVDSNYKANYNQFDYTPGTKPTAPDWDGGITECGGGLHFSPTPWMALQFNSSATKFVACPIKLSDIVVHPNGQYPEKVKAKGCCKPCYECDIDGNPV
jgi:hypothetical protein